MVGEFSTSKIRSDISADDSTLKIELASDNGTLNSKWDEFVGRCMETCIGGNVFEMRLYMKCHE